MESVQYLINLANKNGFYFTDAEVKKAKELFAEETKMFRKGNVISCGSFEAIVEEDSRIVTDVRYTHNSHTDIINNDGWEVVHLKKILE